MSRLKNYALGLVSSYAQIGATVLYSLVSIPLALTFLPRAEFGLWALTSQIAGYLALVDLGMGSSVARILIDHKDERNNGRYGEVIKTGLLVGALQGAMVLVAGSILVWFMADWLRIPKNLSGDFFWLMTGQIVIASLSFVSRMFGQVLFAWQRLDIFNYVQIFQILVSLATLWLGFALGWGVYSLLAGLIAGWALGTAFSVWACSRLKLWPEREQWGQVSGDRFTEMFKYAADIFLIALGSQIIMSSQTVLVSRMLGMDAAAVWSVMTRPFTFVTLIVTRVLSTTMPALAEMQARQEINRLWERYREMFIMVSVFGAVCAILFAACNSPFVFVWTRGRISWPVHNAILLAAWLIVIAQQSCHTGMIMCLKEVREIKYTFLLEGVVFIVAAVIVLPRMGIAGMLFCSVLCSLAFTWANGNWRIAKLTRENGQPLLSTWYHPFFRLCLVMLRVWAVMEWLLRDASSWTQLIVKGACLTAGGLWASVELALPRSLTTELIGRLPLTAQKITARLFRVSRSGPPLQ